MKTVYSALILVLVIFFTGCVNKEPDFDYSNYYKSRPQSILVLPPVNHTTDVDASYAVLSQATVPLSESGYYVIPVSVMVEVFKQNGLTSPYDIQSLPGSKLYEIFGADAVLYIDIKSYGTTYFVLDSMTSFCAEAKLVDLKTSQLLWEGKTEIYQTANKGTSDNIGQMLLSAAISQAIKNNPESHYMFSRKGTYNLLGPSLRNNSLPFGPYRPLPEVH